MYAAPFDYYRAGSIDEAQRLLQQHPGARLLAGGHSLIPLLKMRLTTPPAVVDIGRIPDLKGISTTGGAVRIGALTTHAELAASVDLRSACPALAEAASIVGDAQVRNCGTIGGNIAHADPASDLPTVLLAVNARIQVVGPRGPRTIAAAEFFQGMMTTALQAGEVLTAIEVPARQPGQGMAYVKFVHPASRYAVIGAAAALTVRGGVASGVHVAIGGLVPAPVRCAAVESALEKQQVNAETISRAAAQVSKSLGDDVLGDLFASAEYRAAMAPVFVRRALTTASARAA